MEKVLKITSLKDKQKDYSYWLTKSEAERLEALEFLRRQYINFLSNVEPRLQRVCTIINKAQS